MAAVQKNWQDEMLTRLSTLMQESVCFIQVWWEPREMATERRIFLNNAQASYMNPEAFEVCARELCARVIKETQASPRPTVSERVRVWVTAIECRGDTYSATFKF